MQPIEKAFVRGDEDIHKVLWKRKRNACVHMNHYRSSNVNEVIKTINGPNKLAFVPMYGSIFTGLVVPPYLYCLLVAF